MTQHAHAIDTKQATHMSKHTATKTNVQTSDASAKAANEELSGWAKIKKVLIGDQTDIISIIGRIASLFSVIMYVSYIPQISANLAGHPGTPWQPLAAFFNCVLWSIYGFFKKDRDWPIVIANVPGIFLAGIAFLTSIFA